MTAGQPPVDGDDSASRGPGTANGTAEETEVNHDQYGDPDVDDLLDELEDLEALVDEDEERAQVRETMRLARRLPGGRAIGDRIRKYTTRDAAESVLGSILLSVPMLVEDGVFVIAEWLMQSEVRGVEVGVPVFFVLNVFAVVLMVTTLIYWADIRDVEITEPIFGVVPRRLTGVLVLSYLTAAGLVVLWGRHRAGSPPPTTTFEVVSRITVVWTVAAFGAALGDILPGESPGYHITVENLDDIVRRED